MLPTGYGKSLCFVCLPLVFDELEGEDSTSVVVVTTPLTAIMKDQVKDGLMHYVIPIFFVTLISGNFNRLLCFAQKEFLVCLSLEKIAVKSFKEK